MFVSILFARTAFLEDLCCAFVAVCASELSFWESW